MTDRAARCTSQAGRAPLVPTRPAAGWPGRVMGRYRTSRPAVSERLMCPGRRVPPLRLRSPFKAPGLTVSGLRSYHSLHVKLQ
jgi:hypothetical protein